MVITVWLKFFLCSSALIAAGYKLCQHGDSLARKTNLSRIFIGAIFLAAATSLPEFVTSIGALLSVASVDLALGDAFGTLVINLMIIAILELIHGRGHMMQHAKKGNILYAGMTVALLSIIALGFIVRTRIPQKFVFSNLGIESILIAAIYFTTLWFIFSYEKKRTRQQSVKASGKKDIAVDIFGLLFYIFAVGVAGMWLANIGNEIVEVMGWSDVLVGSIFLGVTTSFPELIVSVSALRVGSVNMAIGNILGSNFFDIMIIPICDLFWPNQSILAAASGIHLITISIAIIITSLVIAGILRPSLFGSRK